MAEITARMDSRLNSLEPTYKRLSPDEIEQEKANNYNMESGTLHEKDGHDCPLCKNKGYIAEVRFVEMYGHGVETLVPCKCQRVRSALARLDRSGLKGIVKKYTFDNYKTDDEWQTYIKERAQAFCQEPKGWFFIGGQSGSGKTHICTAIAVHFIRQGKETKYMLWRDEINEIKGYANDPEKYKPMVDALKNADVLYIDDLFKDGQDASGRYVPPTPAEVRIAFEVLNWRYNSSDLVTIISSERTLFELELIDQSLAGRIAEKTKPVNCCINLKPDRKKNYRMNGVKTL